MPGNPLITEGIHQLMEETENTWTLDPFFIVVWYVGQWQLCDVKAIILSSTASAMASSSLWYMPAPGHFPVLDSLPICPIHAPSRPASFSIDSSLRLLLPPPPKASGDAGINKRFYLRPARLRESRCISKRSAMVALHGGRFNALTVGFFYLLQLALLISRTILNFGCALAPATSFWSCSFFLVLCFLDQLKLLLSWLLRQLCIGCVLDLFWHKSRSAAWRQLYGFFYPCQWYLPTKSPHGLQSQVCPLLLLVAGPPASFCLFALKVPSESLSQTLLRSSLVILCLRQYFSWMRFHFAQTMVWALIK